MSAPQRFSSSSIWLNRLILWLSLFGMILAVHLWIQKARGFDQGCLGLSKHVVVADEGCHEVNELPASHLFGVSNAAWGYAFYFAVALMSFTKLLAPSVWARRLHFLGEIVVLLGFLYSGYLVYQMGFVVHSWCALCLTSAGTVASLVIAHVALRWRGGFGPVEAGARGTELGLAAGGLFTAMGLLIGVVLFVDRLGTRPLDQGATKQEIAKIVGESLPIYIAPAKLAEMRSCHFDWDAKPLDLSKFITPATPFIGKPDGIPVIVFVDPNCPHCREYLPTYLQVIEKYKDRMRFTILPRLLWDASIPQAEALRLAESNGEYFEVWRRMLGRAKGPAGAMSQEEIAALLRDVNIDTTNLAQRLAGGRSAVLAQRELTRIAHIDSVPRIYIGGRAVWGPNRTADCVGTLIERMLAGQVQPVEPANK